MNKTKTMAEEMYAIAKKAKTDKKQEGHICECGLFLGKTGCVYKYKTYPYWKYDSDDIKKIIEKVRHG